jgi:hypothetical protein
MTLPKTPEEMLQILAGVGQSRLYVEITLAARRGRLTEHDIAAIERRVVAMMSHPEGVEHEFQTFETEPVFARVRQLLAEFCAVCRKARTRQLRQTI